ncbi:MAG: hypothetical protein Ta2G_21310 [Termitinemataceae bacterium]|nr:MAG: hypothetical protein Ta2G_21310 [Termitinemataceae bacterium]
MSGMTLLIDTNVIVDYLQNREPFRKNAAAVLDLCAKKRCIGYVAGHTIPTIFYILRKDFSAKDRRDLLFGMCKTLDVAGIDSAMIVTALNNEDFRL